MQCAYGDETSAAGTVSKKCAAPIATSTLLAMPAAECIQTDGDEACLDCVGKTSSSLAMTAAECIHTIGDEARLDCIGKTSSPLATSTAECIQTKRPTRSNLILNLSHVNCGKFVHSDSDNPSSCMGAGRSGDLAPKIGADNHRAGLCR